MAAVDSCEPQIIRALEKDGWRLQRKPLPIRTEGRTLLADCIFERGENGTHRQIVVIEVKCFTDPDNDLGEIYTTIGQYTIYRAALEYGKHDVPLYLAIPETPFKRIIAEKVFAKALSDAKVAFVVVNLVDEKVVSWIP